MSILSDVEIRRNVHQGNISIDPIDWEALQPASLDLKLGVHVARPALPFHGTDGNGRTFIDPFTLDNEQREGFWNRTELSAVGPDRWPQGALHPGAFMLASTAEEIKLSPMFYARVEGKSTLGRWGLLVHTTAGFIDPGFEGPITLELRNVGPFILRLRPGMPICQIAFGRVEGRVLRSYNGNYQHQKGVGLPY